MPDFESSTDGISVLVIPGAGSAGLTWRRAAELLGAQVLPAPDLPSVVEMAEAMLPAIAAAPEPRVLVGASLGAMVSLEIARRLPLQGLVLIATGFGIEVGDSFLSWVASNPPDLFPKMARTSIADRDDAAAIAECVRDFEARGWQVVHHHLRALGAHKPEPLPDPPPTLVIWGEKDHSVPLADHVELAMRLGGLLAPVAGAAHKPFFEKPEATVRWIRWAARWSAAGGAPAGPGRHREGTSPR
jgi:pimeloyl-ACP methyl ester carboxylesterase